MIILRLFDRVLLRWDLERSHIAMACGFGLYLWIAQSFGSTMGPGLRVMSHFAAAVAPEMDAEAVWGSLMIGVGLLALGGLLTGDRRMRQIAAVALAVLWLLMAACFWFANHRSPACLTWIVFAWAAITRVYQIGRRPSSPAE